MKKEENNKITTGSNIEKINLVLAIVALIKDSAVLTLIVLGILAFGAVKIGRIGYNDVQSLERSKKRKLRNMEKERNKRLKTAENFEAYRDIDVRYNEKRIELETDMDARIKKYVTDTAQKVVICVVISLVLFTLSGDTIYAFFTEMLKTDVEEKIEDYTEDYNANELQIINGMSFYLVDSEERSDFEEIRNAVLYMNYDDNMDEVVKEHIRILLDAEYSNTFTNNLLGAEDDLIDKASEMEIEFDTAVKKAKEYAKLNNYQMWNSNLRYSTDLDIIKNYRIDVWNAQKRNAELAMLIANDYQMYALEYQSQKKDGDSILYYYLKSIEWTKYAIVYEDANEEVLFNYMKKRYKDIADCIIIKDEYRKHAEVMYEVLGNYKEYIVE